MGKFSKVELKGLITDDGKRLIVVDVMPEMMENPSKELSMAVIGELKGKKVKVKQANNMNRLYEVVELVEVEQPKEESEPEVKE